MKALFILLLLFPILVVAQSSRQLINRNVYPLNDSVSASVTTWSNGETDSLYYFYRPGKQWSVSLVMLVEMGGLWRYSPEAQREYYTRCRDVDSTKRVHFTPKNLQRKKPQ